VVISDALPLEAALPPVVLVFNREAHNAPAYLISAHRAEHGWVTDDSTNFHFYASFFREPQSASGSQR